MALEDNGLRTELCQLSNSIGVVDDNDSDNIDHDNDESSRSTSSLSLVYPPKPRNLFNRFLTAFLFEGGPCHFLSSCLFHSSSSFSSPQKKSIPVRLISWRAVSDSGNLSLQTSLSPSLVFG